MDGPHHVGEPVGSGTSIALIGKWTFEGHALVSADDRIADAQGDKPAELNHPKDWKRFQAELGKAAVILIGRKSHEADPGRRGKKRIVVSSQARGLERRADGWWWDPGSITLEEALTEVAPEGGLVGIPGGRGVFDMFLEIGFDAFHLARLPTVRLPGGVPVFSACDEGQPAEAVLTAAGLRIADVETLDPAVGLVVAVWRR